MCSPRFFSHLTKPLGFKKILPPVENINFFEVFPPRFPVNFIMTPGIFQFFFPLNPSGNLRFFRPPWNSNYNSNLPPGYNLFLRKPIVKQLSRTARVINTMHYLLLEQLRCDIVSVLLCVRSRDRFPLLSWSSCSH